MSVQPLQLASDLSCYASNQEEARFLYKEIFEDKCYDIAQLSNDAFVIDVGANIGMFCLYMKQKYPLSKVLAFEPAPETVAILRQNMELHSISGIETYSCALGSKNNMGTLTFYPNSPSISTLNREEQEKFLSMVGTELGQPTADKMSLGAIELPVSVKRLSEFLQGREDLVRVDLLKVDVEGMELEVLGGIDDENWALIRNVVMELCDLSGRLGEAENLLRSKGFSVESKLVDWDFKGANMFIVTGRRDTSATDESFSLLS